MKVEHTMTPEEIAQWEKDVALMEYWPGNWEARAEAVRALMRLFRPLPKSHQHGMYSCYASGCRCEKCRVAAREYNKAYYYAQKPGADREAIMRRWRQAEMRGEK